jgi:2-phosphosulfolactate phosphatase
MSRKTEVILTPARFPSRQLKKDIIVVLVDVFRATTSICVLFEKGIASVIPVGSREELQEGNVNGFLTAGERDGVKIDFADFGNSPAEFLQADVKGEKILMSTTNGTRAIAVAAPHADIIIGAFSNIGALVKELVKRDKNILILCSGQKGGVSPEDTLFAGALCEHLVKDSGFVLIGKDAEKALTDWQKAGTDLHGFLRNTEHYRHLTMLGNQEDIRYALTLDTTDKIPWYQDGEIISGIL